MKNLGEKHKKSNDYGTKGHSIVVKGAKLAGRALMGAVLGGGAALAVSGGLGESVGANVNMVRGVRGALGK